MNDLMSIKRISSFTPLLAAYAKVNGGNHFDAIDGGAGSGATLRLMFPYLGAGPAAFGCRSEDKPVTGPSTVRSAYKLNRAG